MEELVTQPKHSLLDQSQNTQMSFHSDGSLWNTNGDGFGVGWYGDKPEPGVFKDATPAWSDENLKTVCAQVKSHLFLAHIRATTTGAVQRSNSHPFRAGQWLFQHNGHVNDFESLRRELQMDIDPELFKNLQGTTDSETFFYLALTYGLKENPKQALQKMVQRVERACTEHNFDIALNLSCAISDGEKLYTFRYANGETAKTQFYSGENECIEDFTNSSMSIPDNSVVVVSEPLTDLSRRWIEIPENSFCTIANGEIEIETFME